MVSALAGGILLALPFLPPVARAEDSPLASFNKEIQPVLDDYCYNCHGDGEKKGGVNLDAFKADSDVRNHVLWWRVMKNVRSGIMPPATEPRVPPDEMKTLMSWIKREAFSLDADHPDPGRVTLRRLNRVEYRNTIRDLTGAEFDTLKEFPADDTGQGFDNLADVLTISPMLLEHYLDAAQTIVNESVPTQARVVSKHTLKGREFAILKVGSPGLPEKGMTVAQTESSPNRGESSSNHAESSSDKAGAASPPAVRIQRPPPRVDGQSLDLSYYTSAVVGATYEAAHSGKYQVGVTLRAVEKYVDDQFDLNRCRLVFTVDGKPLVTQEFVRESDKDFDYTFDVSWLPGPHALAFELQPIGPDKTQVRDLRLRLNAVTVQGPLDPRYWVPPDNYSRFFPKKVPWWPPSRKKYASDILANFAMRAFRRPIDGDTLNRLVSMADGIASQPGGTFEGGVAQAMVAVLASPRFIFRQEDVMPLEPGQVYPYVDEYSLASRLSYFFWSSMPDQELFDLAAKGQLRAQLPAQIARMLADRRCGEFVRNFTGQWLEARDIATVQISPFAVYLREHPDPTVEQAMATFQRVNEIADDKRSPADKEAFVKARKTFFTLFRTPKPQLTEALRDAMRRESEMTFAYVIKEDRPLEELIESNYTFLNEELAKHYGVPGVTGKQMRKVILPAGSPRGGILTEGTVLAVTSNPTRTSPVKRGVFILDAILGSRPPPPPPNIPALEDAASPEKLRTMTLRENLALHASNKMCSSCHSRMDPLGLALENFNAMGSWRSSEFNRTIDPAGKLITGETFKDIRDLKHILATKHRRDFYYCITEKLLTYALGRTLDYYDVETVDRLVAGLEGAGGRPSVLLQGIVNSAPFQQRRPLAPSGEFAGDVNSAIPQANLAPQP
ncbi:MAG TPA: DUF1592 domain-containing protein [Opitutaceae bacterium]|jgi:hypothetical protein